MKRSISPFGLTLTSISAVLGSGWLFSAYYTSLLAGPASILSWVIGGLFMIIIAFVFAEIAAMIPVSGSSTRIPQYTHGTVVSFLFSWMIWLSYIALTSTEVQGIIQYLRFYFPHITTNAGALTVEGYAAAMVLMLIISAINTYSLRWLIRCNNILTVIKVAVPIGAALIILMHYFTLQHTIHPGGSAFFAKGFHGIFAAMTTGGIVFAYNGFKQAAELAGEAKNPARSVPIAVVGSVAICAIIFVLIQVAFLTSLNHQNLAHGWTSLALGENNSPFASILTQDRLSWFIPALYVGAIVSPLAAGLMYCASASRSLYGMSKNGYIPKFFQHISHYGNPIYTIMFNFVACMFMFAPLPGWSEMAAFLSSLIVITYAIGPVCLLALRKELPEANRPIKLPFVHLWALIAFYICTLLAYWSGWGTIFKLDISLCVGIIILALYRIANYKKQTLNLNWKQALWVWPYFIGLSIFSYLGSYDGIHYLSQSAELIGQLIFCGIILILATKWALPGKKTKAYIKSVYAEIQT